MLCEHRKFDEVAGQIRLPLKEGEMSPNDLGIEFVRVLRARNACWEEVVHAWLNARLREKPTREMVQDQTGPSNPERAVAIRCETAVCIGVN
jgi:hypothetical protein